MSERTPKNHKSSHNTPVVLCWDEKKIESNNRQWILFRPQRWDVPYQKPSCWLWEAPVCEKHIPKPAPNGTQNLPRHVDAAPWLHAKFHEFQTSFWLLEFKTRYLNSCGRVTVAGCLTFIPISCMGPKHAPKDTDLIFQPIYMHWSMCM